MEFSLLAGSAFSPYFSTFDVLDTINGEPVSTIRELKKIFYDKPHSKFKIKMMNNVSIHISKSKLDKEQKIIAEKYSIEEFYLL